MNLLEMAFTINPIAFEVGGLQVRWYGVLLLAGIHQKRLSWQIGKLPEKDIEKILSH